jgi:chaperone modulatory protein CbpM
MAQKHIHEGILLDETVTISLTELSELGHVEEEIIIKLVEHGIIEPQNEQPWIFNSYTLTRVHKAIRLHDDLAINWAGISLVLELLDEIKDLRCTVATLKKED